MKVNIPKIKKKINSFLVGEEGKISKDAILKVGAVLGGAAIGIIASAKKVSAHSNGGNDGSCSTLADSQSSCELDRCGSNGLVYHQNSASLKATKNMISTSHQHCIETHGSHGSHGSHCNGGISCD